MTDTTDTETITYLEGQEVSLTREMTFHQSVGGWYNGRVLPEGYVGEITRVYLKVLHVRFQDPTSITPKFYTYSVPLDAVQVADPNAPRPRKLGEPPEGDHISPEDPRIAWLWADAAKFADEKGYCSYYDKIADGLNIPGREREFSVKRKIGGLEAKFKVMARSRKLAEEAVTAKLKEGATA